MHKKIFAALFGLAMIAGVATPLLASGTASAEPDDNANPHAFADTITVCHSTGSDTNPFVVIEVSANSEGAHDAHHDGADTFDSTEGCFLD